MKETSKTWIEQFDDLLSLIFASIKNAFVLVWGKILWPTVKDRRFLILVFFAVEVYLFQLDSIICWIKGHELIRELNGTQAGIFLVSLFTAPLAYFIWSFRHNDQKKAHKLNQKEYELKEDQLALEKSKTKAEQDAVDKQSELDAIKYIEEQVLQFEKAKTTLYSDRFKDYPIAIEILSSLFKHTESDRLRDVMLRLVEDLLGSDKTWEDEKPNRFGSFRSQWWAQMREWHANFTQYQDEKDEDLFFKLRDIKFKEIKLWEKSKIVTRNWLLIKFYYEELKQPNRIKPHLIAANYFPWESGTEEGKSYNPYQLVKKAELCSFGKGNSWDGDFRFCRFANAEHGFTGSLKQCAFSEATVSFHSQIMGEDLIFTNCLFKDSSAYRGGIPLVFGESGIVSSYFFFCKISVNFPLRLFANDCQFKECTVVDQEGNYLRELDFEEALKIREEQ